MGFRSRYTLKFGAGKDKVLLFQEVCSVNGSVFHNKRMDMHLFGYHVANSEFLDVEDKEAFRSFCEAFLSNHKRNLQVQELTKLPPEPNARREFTSAPNTQKEQ